MNLFRALLLSCFLFGLSATGASAAVLDFEDLANSTPTLVNNQYAAQGVTFENPTAFFATPGFAHSGRVAVQPCAQAATTCAAPIAADFSASQSQVGMFVGVDRPASQPLTIRLRLFDAASNVIGTTTTTLPAHSQPFSVQIQMGITLLAATARRAVLDANGADTAGLSVDDVSFLPGGPPAPPVPTTPTPTPPPPPPPPVDPHTTPAPPVEGPFRFPTGAIPVPRVKMLSRIEVVQSVQQPDNSVPLVAANPTSFKRTFARVYLTGVNTTSDITGVSGTLSVHRFFKQVSGPTFVRSLNTIRVPPNASLQDVRQSLDTSLLFELPREWQLKGTIHLSFSQLVVNGAVSTMPCDNCDNVFATSEVASFTKAPAMNVILVPAPYTLPPSTTVHTPSANHYQMIESWLKRAYPDTQVRVSVAPSPLPTFTGVPNCAAVDQKLAELGSGDGRATDVRYYGVVDDNGGPQFMVGCSATPGRYGSGPAGSPSNFPVFKWDKDSSYADWYAGHEIAHLFGRHHPGFCGQDASDPGFPTAAGGRIGDATNDANGYDPGDTALGVPAQLLDWRTGASDVMTYCDDQWVGKYTYMQLMAATCDSLSSPPFGCEAGVLASTPAAAKTTPLGRPAKRATALTITGLVNNGRMSLAPMAVRGLSITPPAPRSPFAVVLRAADGQVLERRSFTPSAVDDAPASAPDALIDEVVPFNERARTIQIVRGAKVLAARTVTANAPDVTALTPTASGPAHRYRTLRWRATDADGGRRWATIQYAPDGQHFVSLVAYTPDHGSLRVDTRRLAGGPHEAFRVLITDGVRETAVRASVGARIAAKPPTVTIASPAPHTTVYVGKVSLSAAITDLQDPAFAHGHVVWRSSLQGNLGTGRNLTATLKRGTHRITVVATNSAGESTATSVRLAVVPRAR